MDGHRVFGLDVVRSLAVSLVLLSHCGDIFALWAGGRNLPLLSYGGRFGVDLFFVLSGLLIGGLLIAQLEAGGPAAGWRGFRVFMLRRWLRTLPLYYVCTLLLAAVWAPLLWGGAAATRLLHAWPAYWLMLQNLAWGMRAPGFFDVTWSLSVEEWFYLGFASLLFASARLWRMTVAVPAATALFVLVPILLRWRTGYDPGGTAHVAVYWLDLIAVGVAAACVRAWRPTAFRRAAWLLPMALAMVALVYAGGLSLLHVPQRWVRVFATDLEAASFALLLPAAARWRDARGPAAWSVRWLSRLSYAVYLVHLSVLQYVGAHRAGWTRSPTLLIGTSVVLIVLLSVGLNVLLEQPIMARRPRADRSAQAAAPGF